MFTRSLALTLALSCWAAPLAYGAGVDLRARARALMEEDQPAEAVKLLEEATRVSPGDAESWAELGNARLALAQFAPAAQAFEQAVKLAPDLSTAQYNYAYALRKAGNLPRAAEAYRVYLARYADDADAHFGLAETLRGLEDNLAAAEAYERYASAEKRSDRAAWVTKALGWARDLRAQQGTASATPAHLSIAATDAPAVPPPMESGTTTARVGTHAPALDRGLVLLRHGRYDDALVELRSAEPSEDPFVNAAIASALLGSGEPAEASAYYTRALAGVPVSGQAAIRLGLAECARRRGDRGGAAAEYRAILADPNATPAVQALARERM